MKVASRICCRSFFKLLISSLLFSQLVFPQTRSLNVNLIGRWSSSGLAYRDIWGYTDASGREYALIGTSEGTAIVDITDSTDVHFVSLVSGSYADDIKTWQHYAYVTTETSGGGIQIIDLAGLPDSVKLVRTYHASVGNAHNLYVDEAGFAYICGATESPSSSGGGLNILDLSDPVFPVEVGTYSVAYMHDVYVRNDTAYGAGLGYGIHIIDVSDKSEPTLINRILYPFPFTHNTWTTENGSYLCTTDEFPGGHLKIFDVRDPFDVDLVGEYTADARAIIHNVHVRGNLAYISYYTEGMRVVDISDPTFPVGVGFYDTSPLGPGLRGNWGVYPFFPSGKVVASDMQSGLYVFRFTAGGIEPGRIEGTVTDSQTGNPIEDVLVQILETGRTVRTPVDGTYRAGGTPGPITLVFSKQTNISGFIRDTLQLTLESGITLDGSIALKRRPSGSLRGRMSHSVTAEPVGDVLLKVEGTPFLSFSDTAGEYFFPFLLADTTYTLSVLKFGFQHDTLEVLISPIQETIQDITLVRDLADDGETDYLWGVRSPEDNATLGLWERGIPSGLHLPIPGTLVQPDSDHTEDGEFAFVTGASHSLSNNPNGRTTLTSPEFDVTDFTDPVINYFRWFYTSSPGEDFLQVDLSSDGGETWTTLENISEVENEWKHKFFRISDFTTPTTHMKIRFVAMDVGSESFVDALMDDFRVTDGVTPVGEGQLMIPAVYRLRQNYPNPFNPSTTIRYELPKRSHVVLKIFNLLGQSVATRVNQEQGPGRYEVRWDASSFSSGIYFYRMQAGELVMTKRLMVLK